MASKVDRLYTNFCVNFSYRQRHSKKKSLQNMLTINYSVGVASGRVTSFDQRQVVVSLIA